MRHAPGLLALTLGLPLYGQGQPLVERGVLLAGAAREAEVAPGTRDTWSLAVAAGEVYELRVEQLGQNLSLTLELGDGTTRKVDERRGWSGTESVRWVASRGATAELRLAPATDRAGRYRVEALAHGPATDADLGRDVAERLMADGAASDSVESWRAAAQAFQALGLPGREVRALFRLSNAASSAADAQLFPEALASAARCRALAEALDDDDARAECLYAQAGALWVAGRMAEAVQPYVDSAAVYENRGEDGPLAVVLDTLATLHYVTGELERAQALSERAVPLLERDGNHAQLAVALNRLAAILGSRGRFSESLNGFERAAEEYARAGSPGAAQAQVNIGILYGQLGDPERSLQRLRAVLASGVAQPEDEAGRYLAAMMRAGIAAAHEDLGDDASAAAEYRKALALATETAGWQGVAAEVASNLGALEARRGNAAAAEQLFETGLQQARAFGDQPRVARTQLEQARARVRALRLDEAQAPLEQAIETFGRLGLVEDEARAWVVRAELLRARGDLTAALERVTAALERIESLRARVALLEQRAQYLGARRTAYDLAVGLLIELHRREPAGPHLARAFEMSERARARSLLDDDARAPAAGLPDLAVRRRAAFERIARLQKEVVAQRTAERPDAQALARLDRDLDEALAQEQSARGALLAQGSRAVALLEPALVSADEAAALLGPDETLLEYYVGREQSWAFALDRGGLRFAALGGERELRRRVDALRAPLLKPSLFGAASYAAAARAAYDVLLTPLRIPVGTRLLRIVPDGPLWELPFEALVTAGTGRRWSDLDYLVKRFSVSYEPSASVAALRRGASARGGGPLLVAFADPHLPRGPVTGPAAAAVERAVLGEGERWSLPRLPCAEREARAAARLLGTGRSRVFTGENARESTVKNDPDVARARYLLFATHGVVSERLPAQSGLVLALSGDGAEDGLLQTYEIAELRLDARLVVLSACESALGKSVKGEGLLGLARAFLQAGAGGLVASLWKVGDCSTAELVRGLFRRLEATAGPRAPAAALREAKLELLRRGEYAHPYYWAPFVLLAAYARPASEQPALTFRDVVPSSTPQ